MASNRSDVFCLGFACLFGSQWQMDSDLVDDYPHDVRADTRRHAFYLFKSHCLWPV